MEDTQCRRARPEATMIYVCSLDEMPRHARALRPSHLVSLLPAAEQPPTPPGVARARHLRVDVDDISEPIAGLVLPQRHHVASLVHFVAGWTGESPLLVHCAAGVSRSMAAAYVALNLEASGREADTARALREAAPHANPNRRIVALADEILGRGGRLLAALETMGPARPVYAAPLVRLARPR